MRISLCLVVVAVLGPSPAGAQTATADGVQALVRGDYQTAARILQPLAENTSQPDPIAQFFLAMLYESGQGVGRNMSRACGLYLSAAEPTNPLMHQSLVLARILQEPMAAAPFDLCSPHGWRDGPTASFALAPNHWIRIDEMGATVGYNGTEQHMKMQMGGAGFVFPPIRYTPLDVSRPIAARRHFIQFFTWLPNKASDHAAWRLAWGLNEVAGPDFVTIAGDLNVLTNTSPRPPESFDPDSVVRVRVDANGEAEWVILTGPSPRSAVIPFKAPR
jgi:hypothetical protein